MKLDLIFQDIFTFFFLKGDSLPLLIRTFFALKNLTKNLFNIDHIFKHSNEAVESECILLATFVLTSKHMNVFMS